MSQQLAFAFEDEPPRPYKRLLYYSIAAFNTKTGKWAISSTCARDDEEGVAKAKTAGVFDGPKWIAHRAWECGLARWRDLPDDPREEEFTFGFDDDPEEDFEFTFEDDDDDFEFNFE